MNAIQLQSVVALLLAAAASGNATTAPVKFVTHRIGQVRSEAAEPDVQTSRRPRTEQFCLTQMADVHLPKIEGRTLIFARYTQVDKEQRMLLAQPGWNPPAQPLPRITAPGQMIQNRAQNRTVFGADLKERNVFFHALAATFQILLPGFG